MKPVITVEELRRLMPNLSLGKAVFYTPFLNVSMLEQDIISKKRRCAFLAQLAHESTHIVCRAGQKHVDAFFRQQDGAFEVQRHGTLPGLRLAMPGLSPARRDREAEDRLAEAEGVLALSPEDPAAHRAVSAALLRIVRCEAVPAEV